MPVKGSEDVIMLCNGKELKGLGEIKIEQYEKKLGWFFFKLKLKLKLKYYFYKVKELFS